MKSVVWVAFLATWAGAAARGQTLSGSLSWNSENALLTTPSGAEFRLGPGVLSRTEGTAPARNRIALEAEAAPGVLRSKVGVELGGLLPLEAISPAPGGGPYRAASGTAFARFADTLTVQPSNPGLVGKAGQVRFQVVVDGLLGARVGWHTAEASSWWFLHGSDAFVADPVNGDQYLPTFDVTHSGLVSYGEVYGSAYAYAFPGVGAGSDFANDLGNTFTFDLPVYFGVPFTIGLGLETGASVQLSPWPGHDDTTTGWADASAAFEHTAHLGVAGVLDGTGALLGAAEYTLQSDSGYGYPAAAVPEPSAWAWMPAVLGPVAWWLRRRGGA